MNKSVLIIISFGLLIALWVIFSGGAKSDNLKQGSLLKEGENVEIRADGVQYITVNAVGGYWPEVSNAKAGIPTKLVVKTSGSYDCSSSLIIRSINYQKVLPNTGEEIIDLGTPKVGQVTQGVCSMGMYSFKLNLN